MYKRQEPIKYKQAVKKPLSPEELEKVRCACEQERDLAIVEFLYSSAVRVSELCRLDRDDICWESDDVMVLGKGNKEREVYLLSLIHIYSGAVQDSYKREVIVDFFDESQQDEFQLHAGVYQENHLKRAVVDFYEEQKTEIVVAHAGGAPVILRRQSIVQEE